jgi:ABC-2 type transport system ATP-binding protein
VNILSEIVVNDVSKSIYGVPIINSISMKLVSGNVYGFQGINGSGKTMLMRLICGLIYPTKGEIAIDGKRLGKEITFPQSVGLLLENPAFLDSYTGYENLEMLASIKNIITREEIHEAITSVGLDPLDKRKYKKFSLGMKQRLGIAAAIMEKPDILILDEPTNSLDSSGVSLVKTIIAKERERGAIIILACHDLPVLQDVSDEIFLLEQGKITEHLYKPF